VIPVKTVSVAKTAHTVTHARIVIPVKADASAFVRVVTAVKRVVKAAVSQDAKTTVNLAIPASIVIVVKDVRVATIRIRPHLFTIHDSSWELLEDPSRMSERFLTLPITD